MRTLRLFWVWYNNLDVVPFLEALDKMRQFWRRYSIDMLKEAISLSGLAFKFEMSFLEERGLHLSSFHTEELYQLFKDNMLGTSAPDSSGGRNASGLGNCRWMATMLAARPPTSFTAVTGTFIDVG